LELHGTVEYTSVDFDVADEDGVKKLGQTKFDFGGATRVGMKMMRIVLHKHTGAAAKVPSRRKKAKKAPPICFDFQKTGRCSRGDACVFSHVRAEEPLGTV
jgi:hypothetical protein